MNTTTDPKDAPQPPPATTPSPVGSYRLVSIRSQTNGGPMRDLYEQAPTGYCIITAQRFMAVITAGGRRFGRSQADKAALFDSLIAYTGTYRIEGNRFITEVDVSWVEYMSGTDQGRTFKIEGKRLSLVTDPAPDRDDPSKTRVAEVVWERVD